MSRVVSKRPGEVEFEQRAFNVERWSELLGDPWLAGLPQRIETDRFGHVITSPPPAPLHGRYQFAIGKLLDRLMPGGRVITECPVSTSEGVKACDVVWVSAGRWEPMADQVCLTTAPEVCVEVVSPSNSKGEIEEKVRLYLEAGATEVWLCNPSGEIDFRAGDPGIREPHSSVCPAFPSVIELD
jgi:Uma2 family endonuclease